MLTSYGASDMLVSLPALQLLCSELISCYTNIVLCRWKFTFTCWHLLETVTKLWHWLTGSLC